MSTSRRGDRRAPVLLAGAVLTLVACGAPAPGPAAPAPQVGAVAAAPASAAPADEVQRIELSYAGGAVTGGLQRIEVPVGSTVELVVASDVADEVHLHGYDLSSFVTAGATTTLRFVADIPGVFEVELEQRGDQLAQLQVS
jgi:hypothetical protein